MSELTDKFPPAQPGDLTIEQFGPIPRESFYARHGIPSPGIQSQLAMAESVEGEPCGHAGQANSVDNLPELQQSPLPFGRESDCGGSAAVISGPGVGPTQLDHPVIDASRFRGHSFHGFIERIFRFFGVHRTSRKSPAGREGNA